MLVEARRTADAVRVAQGAIADDPDSARVRAALGLALLADGQASLARAWLEWSLAADPHQAWVHDLRARAILAGAGTATEAWHASAAALHEDPEDPDSLFTMVRAAIECGDRTTAERAATTLGEVAPASALAPLAGAHLALDRSGIHLRRRFSVPAMVVATIVSNGVIPVVVGIWWIVHVIRRAPHLRQADALVRDALRADPTSGTSRRLLSEILQLRFRYAGSVEGDVALAAIDSGLVDAGELARAVARRTALAGAAVFGAWFAVVLVTTVVASGAPVAVVGGATALVGLGAVVAFERWQTAPLPRLVRRRVGGDPWPIVVALLAVALGTAWAGQYVTGSPDDRSRDVFLAALVATPLVAVVAIGRGALAIRARRSW